MHSEHYPVSPMNAGIPGKYKDPPIPCRDWLSSESGCNYSAEQCLFAHADTGLVGISGGPPLETDRSQTAGFKRKPLRHLTCWFWKHLNCRFGANCKYAHCDTGEMALPPKNWVEPVHSLPQLTDPTPAPSDLLDLPPIEQPKLSPTNLSCHDLNTLIESIFQLDYGDVFGDAHEVEKMLDPLAFVLFHPEHEHEKLELITRWLLMHHVEVCPIWIHGSWEYFLEKIEAGGTGVILASPDFYEHWDLPDFWKFTQSRCRIWAVGYQAHHSLRLSRVVQYIEPEINCVEIFPVGGFIYITDEVFEKRPDQAYQMIKNFVEKIEVLRGRICRMDDSYRVVDAFIVWRLLVRPNFMQWTQKWVMDHDSLLDADDDDVQWRAKIWRLLYHCGYIDQDPTLANCPEDFWPIISENGTHMNVYNDLVQHSQQEADFFGIEGYSVMMLGDELRRSYRHFYVVHLEPDTVRHWQKELQHISDIITPEQCIEYLNESEEVQSHDAKFSFGEFEFEEKPEGESKAFDWYDEETFQDTTGPRISAGASIGVEARSETGSVRMDISESE